MCSLSPFKAQFKLLLFLNQESYFSAVLFVISFPWDPLSGYNIKCIAFYSKVIAMQNQQGKQNLDNSVDCNASGIPNTQLKKKIYVFF